MENLFTDDRRTPSWRPESSRPYPLIELRELALLEAFEPPVVSILRRVTFRKGLNIIWADPKTAEARAGGVRTSGHSAGKTTLCRILRWLLGEAHFGPTEKEIAVSNKFPKGLALLHVNLDGNEWVVGRRFFDKSDFVAAPGVSLEHVLATGWPGSSAKAFLDELTRLTVGSLAMKRFPGRDDGIEWTHLLAWLARDQEAAMQNLEAWRSSVGGPQERGPTKLERHLLMRLVLGLIEKEEWQEMENCARLEAERETYKQKMPDLQAAAIQAAETLRRIVQGDGDTLAGPLLISQATKLAGEKQMQLDELNRSLSQHPANTARGIHEQAIRELERCRTEIHRSTRRLKKLEKQAAERSGELIALKARITTEMRKPPPGYCARKKEEVEGKCKYFIEVTEDFSAAAFLQELEQQSGALQEEVNDEKGELADRQQGLPTLEANEASLRARADELANEREKIVRAAATLAAEIEGNNALLAPAQHHQKRLDENTATINDLSERIAGSRQLQRDLRKERWKVRVDYAEHYRASLAWLLGPEVTGGIQFDDDGLIELSAENRASLSGPAIGAMKIIAFDLAAMFWSVSGKGIHPRLAIHDSPKVADIAPVPYSYLFDLALHAEADAGGDPNFQYILTTTEPPPLELQESEYLRLRLDASTAGGRLFGRDF